MMRVWPCELPRECTSGNCSSPSTRRPRRASSKHAAEPIPPTPRTITSKLSAMRIPPVKVRRRARGRVIMPHGPPRVTDVALSASPSHAAMTRILAALALVSLPAVSRAADIDFNRDVRPILSDKCFACHGPDEKHRKKKLRLDVEQDALDSGAIVPGKPEASPLVERITAADEAERMPPAKSGKKLTAAEIATLKKWVAEGAKYSPA